jgi:hypothetical protein
VAVLKARSKHWKTFLKKSFPNLSKNFNLKPRCGFSKTLFQQNAVPTAAYAEA